MSRKVDLNLAIYRPKVPWPLHSGGAVHTYNLVRELSRQVATLTLITDASCSTTEKSKFSTGISFKGLDTYFRHETPSSLAPDKSILRKKYINYWGTSQTLEQSFCNCIEALKPDAVVAVGPLGPIFLNSMTRNSNVPRCQKVWYAADDLALQQITLMRRGSYFKTCLQALKMALYERAFSKSIDTAWVVSKRDQRAMKLVTGVSNTAIITNGVDTSFFARPIHAKHPKHQPKPNSCVFWGALDFQPNIDAIAWFVKNVWYSLRQTHNDASLCIFGLRPPKSISELDGKDGITIKANVPDIRPVITQNAVAVFPFVSGTGIKNKVLEAAALSMPTVGSQMSSNGLLSIESLPMIIARSPRQWKESLQKLWASADMRNEMGDKMNSWVRENHSWHAASAAALKSIADHVASPKY